MCHVRIFLRFCISAVASFCYKTVYNCYFNRSLFSFSALQYLGDTFGSGTDPISLLSFNLAVVVLLDPNGATFFKKA